MKMLRWSALIALGVTSAAAQIAATTPDVLAVLSSKVVTPPTLGFPGGGNGHDGGEDDGILGFPSDGGCDCGGGGMIGFPEDK